jgi:dTDP-4-amino-4,6-dideoxygalactose transaminase
MMRTWPLILVDIVLVVLATVIGLMLRLEIIYVGYFIQAIWPFIVLAAIIRPVILYVFGIYQRIWRYASMRDYVRLALAVIAGTVVLAAITLLWLFPGVLVTFPRSLLIIEAVLSFLFLGGVRAALGSTERYSGDIDWKKVDLRASERTLIVGAGSAGTQMVKELVNNPQIGLKPVAFLDDDIGKVGRKIHGLTVYGPLVRLPEIVEKHQIEHVLIAIPSAPVQTIQNLKGMCQKLRIPYSTMPHLSSFLDYSSGTPSPYRVPMAMPDITGEEIRAVVRVMQSRNLSIGYQTTTLEYLAAEVADASYGVAVVNGTSALHLCMIAAGVGPGDEVITSPYSFVASSNCILYQGAKPVFVDVDPATLNIDPSKIEAAITERTRAIIPVHIFGQPADLDPILEIADRYNLTVIEDAAEAIGAEYKGRRVGALGKAGVFAFYPNKQMTTGEGAVIVTNDAAWRDLFRSLRNQGRDKFDEWLRHSRLGYNYRMSELNAAVGVVQMQRLDELLHKREQVAREYNKLIAAIDEVDPLTIVPDTTRMSWFVYVVRFAPTIDRDRVMALLAERGIPARPYFSPIHLQPFYRKQFGFQPGDYPEAEAGGRSTLALPFHTSMNKDEIKVVCDALGDAIIEAKINDAVVEASVAKAIRTT